MSKFAEAMDTYKAQVADLGLGISEDLLTKVAKGLGPSIYNADSSKVSGSDKTELDRVKTNYLMKHPWLIFRHTRVWLKYPEYQLVTNFKQMKKLGMEDSPALDAAIAEVMEKMGSSNRNKYRAVVYALLCMKFGKEGVYA